MKDCYEVYEEDKVVGKVQLLRQGLYYRIVCRCRLSGDRVRRLFADQENGRENLGVLVPEDDGFVLDKRIPVKKLLGNELHFYVCTGGNKTGGKLVPISPEEPFLYLDRLKNAFLESENGKQNIRLKESPETE